MIRVEKDRDLRGEYDWHIDGLTAVRCDLAGELLPAASITYQACKMCRVSLERVRFGKFSGCDLDAALVVGMGSLVFERCDLTEADMRFVVQPGAGADFVHCDLTDAHISGHVSPWVRFERCDLTVADLSGVFAWEGSANQCLMTVDQIAHLRLNEQAIQSLHPASVRRWEAHLALKSQAQEKAPAHKPSIGSAQRIAALEARLAKACEQFAVMFKALDQRLVDANSGVADGRAAWTQHQASLNALTERIEKLDNELPGLHAHVHDIEASAARAAQAFNDLDRCVLQHRKRLDEAHERIIALDAAVAQRVYAGENKLADTVATMNDNTKLFTARLNQTDERIELAIAVGAARRQDSSEKLHRLTMRVDELPTMGQLRDGLLAQTRECMTLNQKMDYLERGAGPLAHERMAKLAARADLVDDVRSAALRTAARQLVRLTTVPLSAALVAAEHPATAMAALALDTSAGKAVWAGILSFLLTLLPPSRQNEDLRAELRVLAMADAGDLVADLLMGPLREALAGVIAGEATAAPAPPALPERTDATVVLGVDRAAVPA